MSKHTRSYYNDYTDYRNYSVSTSTELEESESIDILEEPVEEEVVQEPEPEISPEEKIEKIEANFPNTITLETNLYIREKPYGDKVKKDELDRIIASKVIKDSDGWAIVPKETKTEVYDMMVHKDGSIWYATRFGYLLGKTKRGKKYVR